MTRRVATWLVIALPYETLITHLGGPESVLKPYRVLAITLAILVLTHQLMTRRTLIATRYLVAMLGVVVLEIGILLANQLVGHPISFGIAWEELSPTLFAALIALSLENIVGAFEWFRNVFPRVYFRSTAFAVMLAWALLGFHFTGRFSAFYENPNRLAMAGSIALVLAAASWLYLGRSGGHFVLAVDGPAALIIVVGIVMSGSFTTLAAVAAGAVGLAWGLRLAGRRQGTVRQVGRLALGMVLAVGIGVVLVRAGAAPNTGVGRLVGRADPESLNSRIDLAENGFRVASAHLFLGAGFAQYRTYHERYLPSRSALRDETIKTSKLGVHDEYINELVSGGLLAFVLFVWIFVGLLRSLADRLRRAPDGAVAGAFAAVIIIGVAAFAHNLLLSPDFWVVIAFAECVLVGQRTTVTSFELAVKPAGQHSEDDAITGR